MRKNKKIPVGVDCGRKKCKRDYSGAYGKNLEESATTGILGSSGRLYIGAFCSNLASTADMF
jgi:hypothetical protein